jgi:hypothetical protein
MPTEIALPYWLLCCSGTGVNGWVQYGDGIWSLESSGWIVNSYRTLRMIVERLSSASIILSHKLFGLLDPKDEVVSDLSKKESWQVNAAISCYPLNVNQMDVSVLSIIALYFETSQQTKQIQGILACALSMKPTRHLALRLRKGRAIPVTSCHRWHFTGWLLP